MSDTQLHLAGYRKRYKDAGSGVNCGDWLAKQIDSYCGQSRTDAKSRKRRGVDFDKFDAMLLENGVVAIGKWTEGRKFNRHGWQGRYRMHGRQKLEAQVIANRRLWLPDGGFVEPPESWLNRVTRRKRHA